MGMYEARAGILPTTDLNQGDILRNVVRPKLVPAANICPIRSKTKVEFKDKGGLQKRDPDLRAISSLEYLDFAIVLSPSCDNARGTLPLILAPVTPFAFKAKEPVDQWIEISTAATGTAAPRLFYLPANAEVGLPRSEAQFSQLFVVSHDLLKRCAEEAGTARVCGLTHDATAHLQWALNLFFGRNPRDDNAWPSNEDYELKLSWVDAWLATARQRRDTEKVAELEATRDDILKRLGREATEGAIQVTAPDAAPADAEALQADVVAAPEEDQ